MSDYMFMLENHLSADQSRVVAAVQEAASADNIALFLTGGAMRDMLGGFVIRDLDFTVEGNAVKLAKEVAKQGGGTVVSLDDHRKCVELLFPGAVTCEIAMARREKYPKPGAKPQVSPATIYEDLQGRDFSINAIALSLNRGSRGLLIDPTNGLADLERKEIRATGNYNLSDDPARLLRLVRFRTRLGFAVDEKTQSQYQNAREAGMESRIPARTLFRELKHIADERDPSEVVRALEQEKLLTIFSPALSGPKLSYAGLAKILKAKQTAPFEVEFRAESLGLFLFLLTEKLNPKEKSAFVKATAMQRSELEAWQKLEAKAKKLESTLKSPKIQKPSQLYAVASRASGDQLLFLLIRSQHRLVQDRIRNYLQKYLLAAQEITDAAVVRAKGLAAGTPKFRRAKEEAIAARLDSRAKKAAPPEPQPAPFPFRR